jgi:sugar lactone lactonase YvrE
MNQEHPIWTTVVTTPSIVGESPFWHPQEQALYWVDIPGFSVQRLNPATGHIDRWAMPSEACCMAPATQGGLVIALRDRVVRAPAWGGALHTIATFSFDASKIRFNDGKCDALGRFWAGTLYEPRSQRAAELFSIDARAGKAAPSTAQADSTSTAQVQRMAGDATLANGLAFSPDALTAYWADTTAHVVYQFDYDLQNNTLSNQRVFKQFATKPEGWKPFQPDNGGYMGRPDGATVDSLGNYWVAMFEGQRILQIAPNGEILRDIATPVLCNTMPCFGGEDLRTLYLTTARHQRSEADLLAQPQLGCVFSTRMDVAGLPVQFFADQDSANISEY